MTIDEAIKHAEEVAEEKEQEGKLLCDSELGSIGCLKCAKEHHQLVEWFRDYKRLKEREPVLEKIKEKYALMKVDERKKGKWINKSHTSGCGIKFAVSECSCCGKKTFFDCDQLVYNYCPNCGAEME